MKVATFFFHQVGQIWVWWALDLPDLCGIARSNLGMVSGLVLLKIKGKSWIFMNKWKLQPCFFTKSVKFGFGELSICRICAESRDLQSGHGFRACSFKNKRKKLDFHTFGGQKNEKKSENLNEIGQILVSGALDRTKSIRKTAADIFAKSGLEKPWKNVENSTFSLDVSPFFPWT